MMINFQIFHFYVFLFLFIYSFKIILYAILYNLYILYHQKMFFDNLSSMMAKQNLVEYIAHIINEMKTNPQFKP